VWQQKLVILVVAITVGDGLTTVAVTIHYTNPCRTVCRQSAKTVNVSYFAAFHTMHLLGIKRSE
jgi:ethanolamine ammonia-lyase small subunit